MSARLTTCSATAQVCIANDHVLRCASLVTTCSATSQVCIASEQVLSYHPGVHRERPHYSLVSLIYLNLLGHFSPLPPRV